MIRKNLIEYRQATGMTQKEIAKEIGISERMYRHLELGTREGSIQVWRKLQSILKSTIDELSLNMSNYNKEG